MTALVLNHLIRRTPALLQRVSRRISTFLDGIGEARAMAERFKVLSRMTDSQLARLGLKREDIPKAVLSSFGRK